MTIILTSSRSTSVNYSTQLTGLLIGIIDQTESLLLYKNFYSVHLQLHNHNLTITLTPIFDLLEIKLMQLLFLPQIIYTPMLVFFAFCFFSKQPAQDIQTNKQTEKWMDKTHNGAYQNGMKFLHYLGHQQTSVKGRKWGTGINLPPYLVTCNISTSYPLHCLRYYFMNKKSQLAQHNHKKTTNINIQKNLPQKHDFQQ